MRSLAALVGRYEQQGEEGLRPVDLAQKLIRLKNEYE